MNKTTKQKKSSAHQTAGHLDTQFQILYLLGYQNNGKQNHKKQDIATEYDMIRHELLEVSP